MEKGSEEKFKKGVSGIMRVKDDAEFIEACIESCISALDELIIVYNDCTDESPQIIEKMQNKYPDKIKVFPYDYHIYALNLTKQEYEYALSLPKDSPHLLCNYYNFALSKVSRQYAMKIDADQIYFTEKLKEICNVVRDEKQKTLSWRVLIGLLIYIWSSMVKKMNVWSNHILPLLPLHMSDGLKKCYDCFLKYCMTRNMSLSFSGIHLIYSNGKWLVPLGLKKDNQNILPPFNGAGDHLLFRMVKGCYYETYDSKGYSTLRNDQYTLIEKFVHPHRCICAGYFWAHLNMMRTVWRERNLQLIKQYPDRFLEVKNMKKMDFYRLDKLIDCGVYLIPHRSYSQFCLYYDKKSLDGYLFDNVGSNHIMVTILNCFTK